MGNLEIANQFRVTKTIYSSIFTGMFVFLTFVIIIIQGDKAEGGNDLDKIFTIIVPVFGLLSMFIARMIYNRMIGNYSAEADLIRKIMRYRTAKIISWALVEAACLLALIATMFTSNYLYIVVIIFLFGYYLMLKPSKESLIRDLHLSAEESDIILNN